MGIGCGAQLALKFLQNSMKQIGRKDAIAIADMLKEHVEAEQTHTFLKDPVASGIVSVIDDKTAEMTMPAIIKSKTLVICCNMTPNQKYAKIASSTGCYAATASISKPDDLLEKINKAFSMEGLRFIEILTPCPKIWGFDTSNAVAVARAAVESGIWPLFEIENKKTKVGKRPEKLGVLETFHNTQKKFVFDQKTVEENWKRVVEASLK